jgi:hypothetical protein
VPSSIPKSASATFKAYINGNYNAEMSVDNIKYAATITIPVKGNGVQRVTIEAINNDRGKKVDIAEYEVNFDFGIVSEVSFSTVAFAQLFEGDPLNAQTAPAVTTAPPYYPYDPFTTEDTFWQNVFGE